MLAKTFKKLKNRWRKYWFQPYKASREVCGYELTISIRDLFGKDVYDFQRNWPELEWAKNLISGAQGDVVDVGANQGIVSIAYAKMIEGGDRRIIACEPHPGNAALIRENIALNDVTCIDILESGIANAPGQITISDHSNARIVSENTSGVVVPVQRLDDVIKRQVDLLKIDVEGMESQVLEGARDTIRRYRPAIDIECHLFCYAEPKSEFLEIFSYIIDQNYSILAELGYQGEIISLDCADEVSTEHLHHDIIHLLCTPK